MAHFFFNPGTQYGALLRTMLNLNEAGDEQVAKMRSVMIEMRSGDGSQDSHYAVVMTRFGFESNTAARAAFEEIDSAYAKTSGNGSVTNVRAARDQLYARLRG